MSDMQRYGYCSTCVCPLPKADGRCLLVLGMALLADAKAAIAAARAEAVAEHIALADKVWVDMLAKAEAAAEQRGWDVGYDAGRRDERAELRDPGTAATRGAYEQGQRDMLAKCIHKVSLYLHEEICTDTCRGYCAALDDVISALRALKEKP